MKCSTEKGIHRGTQTQDDDDNDDDDDDDDDDDGNDDDGDDERNEENVHIISRLRLTQRCTFFLNAGGSSLHSFCREKKNE